MKTGLVILMLVVSSWVHAATYYTSNAATTTYNFNSIANWKSNTDGSGSSPGTINSADDYVVRDGFTATVDANISVRSITVGSASGATLVIGNSTTAYTVTLAAGGLVINTGSTVSPGAFNAIHTITCAGPFTVNGTFNGKINGNSARVVNVTLSGTNTIGGSGTTCFFNNLTIAATTITTSRNITVAGTLNVSNGFLNLGSNTHTFNGNISVAGAITPATSTVNLSASLFQSVSGGGIISFNVLNVNNGGTITLGSNITINSNFTINGGSTVFGGATLTTTTINGNLTVADGSLYTNPSNTVTFAGTTQTVDIGTANATFNILNFNTSSTTKSLVGNLTTSGLITVASGVTLNSTSGNHVINGGLTVTGTSNFGGTILFSSAGTTTLTGNGSAVIYLGTVPVTIAGQLQVAAGHTWNLNSSISINSGYLILNGTVSTSATVNDLTGTNAFTLAAGARLYCRGNNSFPNNFGTLSISNTSTVYYDASFAQTIRGAVTYGTLTTGGSGIKTASAGLIIAGNIDLNATTTLALSNFSHTFSGGTIINSSLRNGSITSSTGGTFTFAGADINQTINSPGSGTYTFDNLVFTNTTAPTAVRVRTFQGIATVNGDITVSNTAGDVANRLIIDLGGNALTKVSPSGTLTLGAYCFIYGSGASNIGTTFASFTTTAFNAASGVRFNGTTQNIPADTYGNLEISGNGTKTVLGDLVINGDVLRVSGNAMLAMGSNTFSVAGDWNMNSATLVTQGTSTVIFNGVDQDIFTSPFYNVVYAGTGTKTIQGTQTVKGNFTVNNGSTVSANSRTVNLAGNLLVNTTGVFTQTTGGLTMNGIAATPQTITLNAASNLGSLTLIRNSGLVANNVTQALSNVTVLNNFVWVNGGSTTSNIFDLNGFNLQVGGTWTYQGSNSNFLANGGTVEYTSGVNTQSIQNISSTNPITYANLIFSGNGPKQLNNGAVKLTGNVTICTGAIVTTAQNIYIGGNWVNNGTFTQTGGTVQFDGAGAQSISASSFQSLTIGATSGGAGIKTLTGSLVLAGNLLINGTAELDVSESNYSIDVDNNITVGSTAVFTARRGLVTVNNTSTITMNGTGVGHRFYDLEVASNTATVTASGAVKVSRNLTITTGTLACAANALIVGASLLNSSNITITGTLTFDGTSGTSMFKPGISTFGPITVNASGATYQLSEALTMGNTCAFNMNAGTFSLNGNRINMNGGLNVSGGIFEVNAGSVLAMSSGNTINTTGGTFRVVGTSSSLATVTCQVSASFYAYTQSAGILEANYYQFSNTSGGGLILSGATTIHGINNLSNGRFSSGQTGASNAYLTLTGLTFSPFTVTNVTFNSGPTSNVIRASGTGVISFQDALGSLAGNAFRSGATVTSGLAVFTLPAGAVSWDGGGLLDNSWNNALNWSNDIVPTSSTLVYLDNSGIGGPYTVLVTGNSVAGRVVLGGTENAISLTLNRGTLAVFGTLSIGTNSTLTQTGATDVISVTENWFNYGGTFNEGTSTVIFNGSSGTSTISTQGADDGFYNVIFNASGANYSLNNTLAVNNEMTLTNGTLDVGSYDLNLMGNFTRTTGTFIPRLATVILNGAAQTVTGGTFYNLTTAGSGTKTLSGTTTLNGNMTIGNGTVVNGGSNIINVKGNWVNNATGGFSQTTTGSVFFNGGNQTVSSGNATTFQNVYLSGAGIKIFSANATVNGDFSMLNTVTQVDINNGVTLTGTGSGTFSQLGGTLRILGASFPTLFGSYSLSAGTVTYFASAQQTIQAATYNNLTLTSNGSVFWKVANGNVNVNGTFNIGDAYTKLQMGGFNLTLSGAYVHTGTTNSIVWGTGNSSGTLMHNGGNFSFPANVDSLGNVELSGSGIKTITANLILAGNLTVNSGVTMNMGTNTIQGATGKTFTLNDGSVANCANIVSMALPTGFTNYNFGTTSIYRVNGTSNQTLSNAVNYGGLDISTAGGTASFATVTPGTATVTVNGNFTMTGGLPTLSDGGNNIIFNGASTNLRNFIPSSGTTQTFSGAAQTITNSSAGFPDINFNNLVLGGTGIKRFSNNSVALQGALIVNTGVSLSTAFDVTVLGNFTNSGTYTQTAGTTNFTGLAQTIIPGVNAINAINFGAELTSTKTISTNGLVIGTGAFTISDNASVNLGTLSHTIGSSFINFVGNGTWNHASASISFNRAGSAQSIPSITTSGNLSFSGAGSIKTLLGGIVSNDVIIGSGSTLDVDLTSSYQITCRNNFICHGTFLQRTGLVRMDASTSTTKTITCPTFYQLNINQANGSPMCTMNLGTNTVIQNTCAITFNGNLNLNGYSLTLGVGTAAGSMVVGSTGTLTVGAGSSLLFNNTYSGGSLFVQSGGLLSLVGNTTSNAVLGTSAGTFRTSVTIQSGGTIGARYYAISNIVNSGFNVASGAIVDNTNNFSDGTWSGINTAGTGGPYKYLLLNSVTPSTNITNVTFNHGSTPVVGQHVNVERTTNAPVITFSGNISGLLAGSIYEFDGNSIGLNTNSGYLTWPAIITSTWTGIVGDNNWFTPGNWTSASVPDSNTNVIIPTATFNPSINANGAICRDMTITSGVMQLLGGNHLNVKGNLIIGTGTSSGTIQVGNSASVISVSGNFMKGTNGLYSANNSTIRFTANGNVSITPLTSSLPNVIISGAGTFTWTGTTTTVNGNLTQTNGTLFFSSANYVLNVNGNYSNTGGVFNRTTTGSVVFGGTTQSITGGSFVNVSFSGSGTKTSTNALDISGNLIINNGATLLMASGAAMSLTGNMVLSTGGTFNGGNSNHNYYGGSWTGGGSYTGSGSSVTFQRVTGMTGSNILGTVTISTPSFESIILAGNNNYSFTSAVAMTGDLTLVSGVGTVYLNSNQITRTNSTDGTLTMGASTLMNVSGNNFPIGFNLYSLDLSSQVQYNGTSNQTIAAATYGILTLNNSNTKTLGGNIVVLGNININSSILDVSTNNYKINVGGNFNNNGLGSFNCGTGQVVFDGSGSQSISLTNTGTKTFYDLQVNKSAGTVTLGGVSMAVTNDLQVLAGTYSNGGLITYIGGDLIAAGSGILATSGTFFMNASSGTAGTIQMNGSSVNNLTIQPVSGFTYTVNDPLIVNASLIINSGIFYANGKVITVGNASNSLTVAGGTYKMGAGGTLKLGNATTVTINSGASFEAVGTAVCPVLITRRNIGNTFSFNINGNIAARYYQFEFLNATGVQVNSTGIIHNTNNFSDGTFTNGTQSGAFMRLENSQSFTTANGRPINNVKFLTNPGSGSFNVTKTTNSSGIVEFYNSTGAFANASFENDAFGLINWTGPISLTWNGKVSTDWFTAANWTASYGQSIVPDSTTNVTILTGNNNCVISGGNAYCGALTTCSGSILSINSTTSTNVDLDVKGNITIGGVLLLSTTNDAIQVRGNWTRTSTGTFTPGLGSVQFYTSGINTIDNGATSFYNLSLNSPSTLQLAAHTTVSNNLIIRIGATLDVSASNYNLTVGGIFTNQGTFIARSGTLILNAGSGTPSIVGGASSMYNLTINPASGVTYSLSTSDTLKVLNTLNVTTGTLNLNGLGLRLGDNTTSPTLNVNGTLIANANSVIALASNAVVNVNSGGTFNLVGTSNSLIATITRFNSSTSSTGYTFNVNSGGTIGARYYLAEYMNANGIYVKTGATVNSINNFSDGTLSNGATSGQYLYFDNDFGSAPTLANVAFNNGPLYNVRRTIGTNNVTLHDPTGSLGQFLYEKDEAAVSATAGKIRVTYTYPTVTWTGGTSTDWAIGSNWSGGAAPTSTSNVFIASGTTFQPTISAATIMNNLTVNSGAAITIGSNANVSVQGAFSNNGIATISSGSTSTFTVAGAFSNNGTFNNSSVSTIELTAASGIQTITNNAGTIKNLKINSGGGSGSAIFNTSGSMAITGDVLITAGTLKVNQAAHTLTLSGNWNQTGGAFSHGNGTVILAGTGVGTQTITALPGSPFYSLTMSGSMTKSLSSDVTVSKSLNINTGSNLSANARTINVAGNFVVSGTGVFTAGSGTVNCNGNTNQVITPGNSAFSLNNLILNNSSASVPQLTLTGAVSVSNTLTLTAGRIATTSSNLITMNSGSSISGGSSTSYIIGPLRKVGNTSFIFPVGTSSYRASVGISAPSTSSTFTAQYYASRNANSLTAVTGGLTKVSSIEFWDLTRSAGTASPFVTLYFESGTRSAVGNSLASLKVAHWTGSAWENLGGTVSGNTTAGTITSTIASTSFSPFTLATTSSLDNPLPVTLKYFNGTSVSDGVQLNWATATELNNKYFTVERSLNGTNWERVAFIEGAGNSNSLKTYGFLDKTFATGRVYYRLSQTDVDGTSETFPLMSVICGEKSVKLALEVYPNPTSGRVINLKLNGLVSGDIAKATLMNISGQVIDSKELVGNENGVTMESLSLPSGLAAGVYMLNVQNSDQVVKSRIVLQ